MSVKELLLYSSKLGVDICDSLLAVNKDALSRFSVQTYRLLFLLWLSFHGVFLHSPVYACVHDTFEGANSTACAFKSRLVLLELARRPAPPRSCDVGNMAYMIQTVYRHLSSDLMLSCTCDSVIILYCL